MSANGLPSIFVGASSEANELTEQLVAALTGGGDVHVVPWFDAFDFGFSALEDLAARIEEVDFAALLLVPDDTVTRRQAQHDVPRDNVVFELGLFMGKLSRTRAFALVEEGVTLPSDLQGVTVVRFQRDAIGAAAERIAKRMRDLGPAPRVPVGAHIVDCGREGRNVHSTIASAVAAAAPNDVVLVRPGTYAEQIVVDRPLEIIGMGVMGEQHRPVLRSTGSCAVTYRAANGVGRISSLQIEGGGDGGCASVDVPVGHLVLDGCEIGTVGPVEASVRVRHDGFARIVGNRITCGTGIGLLVCERGDADVSNNVITGHAHSCVEVRDGTRPRIANNSIGEGRSGGVLVRGAHSRPRIERNDVFENKESGIAVTSDAHPTVKGNRVHDGYGPGLWFDSGGGGTVSENDVYGNRGTGIEVVDGGRPLLEGNRIYNGRSGGVVVGAGGRARIEHNEIRGNRLAGIVFREGAEPETFSSNTVVDGRAEGVLTEVPITSDDNLVDRNAGGDWRGP